MNKQPRVVASLTNTAQRTKKSIRWIFLSLFVGAAATACGGGGGGGGSAPQTTPTTSTGSSLSSSGAAAIYSVNGVSYALIPSSGSSANLVELPNTGDQVAAISVAQVSVTPITTSLTTVSGTSVDAANDLGIAFDYNETKISFFKLSTKTEISTYDTKTVNIGDYSGASPYIAGVLMDVAHKTVIAATGDGFDFISYADPSAPTLVAQVPSLAVDSSNGVEVMENFAFDPSLSLGGSAHPMIITGGNGFSGSSNVMVLIDAQTHKVYRPDAATNAFFATNYYIDSAGVDTTYHEAILADEGTGTTFVDLNQISLNDTDGSYSLPTTAVKRITDYYEMDNLGIESTNHMVMMAEGFGGTSFVVGQLEDPKNGLGFVGGKVTTVTMPGGVDNNGASVNWSGGKDPHGSGAYITPADHPTYTTPTSLGFWMNYTNDHIAIINLQAVLDGALASSGYDPEASTPKDIAYFDISGGSGGGTGTGGSFTGTATGGSVTATSANPTAGNLTLVGGSNMFVSGSVIGSSGNLDFLDFTTAANVIVLYDASTGVVSGVTYSFNNSGTTEQAGCGSLYVTTTCSGVSLDLGTKTLTFSNTSLGAGDPTYYPSATASATLNGSFTY